MINQQNIYQHSSFSTPVYKSLSNYFKEMDLPLEAIHYDSLHLSAVKTLSMFLVLLMIIRGRILVVM
jgi:hypothetical protein